MPTYEYKCSACGQKFEKFQSMTSAPIRKCPHCGKNKVERLIGTGAGLIFKGSGFYITDYRSEGYKEKAKAESGAGDGKKTEGGSSTESKPAEKKESSTAPTASESKPAEKTQPKTDNPSSKSADKKNR
jgi:putative FmdB family regulatory protein